MGILPTSFSPLSPLQPQRSQPNPTGIGEALFGKPLLQVTELSPVFARHQAAKVSFPPEEDFLDGLLKDLSEPRKPSQLDPIKTKTATPTPGRPLGGNLDITA